MTAPKPPPPPDGPWVEEWLSAERFATYLHAASGDRGRALMLYEWNARVSSALLHDLAHLEVGMRNAYDRALSAGDLVAWTDPSNPLFQPLPRNRGGRQVDVNERFRQQIADAREQAATPQVPQPQHCDVVAQLGFGFWRYLGSRAHEKTIWVPRLHKAFPKGTNRQRDVDEPLVRLNKIRNRVAHHEPLLAAGLTQRVDDILRLAGLLHDELRAHIAAFTSVGQHVSMRP